MKLGKATIYFYGFEGNEPLDVLERTLSSRDWVYYGVFNYESVEIGEWYDSIDLNDTYKTKQEKTYLDYFSEARKTIISVASKVANIMSTSKYTGVNIDQAISMVVATDEITNLTLTDAVVFEIKLKVKEILKMWED